MTQRRAVRGCQLGDTGRAGWIGFGQVSKEHLEERKEHRLPQFPGREGCSLEVPGVWPGSLIQG